MSNENPAGPPPPYPGGYSTASDYSSPPQAYDYNNAPPAYSNTYNKDAGTGPGSYQTQPGPYPTQPGAYPVQPYGQGQMHGTTVVVQQPTVTLVQTFRENPVRTRCNHCQAEIVTGLHYETGTFAWVICFVLWLVGCGLGCCLIPFCVDNCKDVIHTCPNCHQQIARYSRM